MKRYSLVLFAVASALCAACGATVSAYSGPDRPDDVNVLGPPPPPDFQCERGKRQLADANGDKHPDQVTHSQAGEPICRGTDENFDGRIDTWERLERGHVVERVRDTNRDGVFDERARDTNGDGTLDQVVKGH